MKVRGLFLKLPGSLRAEEVKEENINKSTHIFFPPCFSQENSIYLGFAHDVCEYESVLSKDNISFSFILVVATKRYSNVPSPKRENLSHLREGSNQESCDVMLLCPVK